VSDNNNADPRGLYYDHRKQFNDWDRMAEESLIIEFAQRVFECMEKENISKEELAKRLNCSKGNITRILRGPNHTDIREMAKIMWALGYELILGVKPREDK
jgi:ribosome-binding protein aMBF1 (putative translation factor)